MRVSSSNSTFERECFFILAAPGRIANQIIDHAHDEPALPFDLAQMRVIRYDHTSLDSAERCRQTLVEHLRAGLEGAADLEVDGESQWQGFAKETGTPRFKYGDHWVLRDKESGEPRYDMGRIWAKQFRHDFDHRPLSETGIRPGMRLEAIRPPRRLFRQHP